MRWWKSVPDFAKTLVGIGAGLIGVVTGIESFLATELLLAGIWVGLLLCASGIALAGRDMYASRRTISLAKAIRAGALDRVHASYTHRSGIMDDITDVYELGLSVVGVEYHVTPTHLAALMKPAPGVLTIVDYQRPGSQQSPRIAGYFVIYPLKASACQRILSGEIVSGFAILPPHLQSGFAAAKGIYIAQVTAASSPLDRTAVLVYLHDFVARIIADPNAPLAYVFTRPGTKTGHRWVNALSFTPVGHPRSLIWKLERKAVRALFGQPPSTVLLHGRNQAPAAQLAK